jgi:hypothetical protein
MQISMGAGEFDTTTDLRNIYAMSSSTETKVQALFIPQTKEMMVCVDAEVNL